MKGKYHVLVQDRRLRYEFEIRRNITIIRGDSATGKTTLLEMISAYEQGGVDSGIEIECEKRCVVLSSADWKIRLEAIHNSLVFLDELARFTSSEEFASSIRHSDNYFIIVTREALANLPYSVEEVYGIRSSAKYAGLKKTYHEFYRIYGVQDAAVFQNPETVVVEDSNAGFSFFQHLYDHKQSIQCLPAEGKSNIHSILQSFQGRRMLVIADGAAFGSEMERILRLLESGEQIALYLPESFEWLILNSGVLHDPEIQDILHSPENYIESADYFSWEQYFTALLIKKSEGTYLRYAKKSLNPAYLQDRAFRLICKSTPLIEGTAEKRIVDNTVEKNVGKAEKNNEEETEKNEEEAEKNVEAIEKKKRREDR